MQTAELVLALLIVVAVLVSIARRVGVAYPIFLVLGGLAIGALPGVPRIEIEPDILFLLVLPPLLYSAAFFTPLRSFRENRGTILSLAVGLVIATAAAVALTAHLLLPDLPWPVAIALGAILAPPDAIAATAVASRLAVPRAVLSILEGESLLNDATALTLYRMALVAAAAGSLAPLAAVGTLAFAAAGGALIGLAVGWAVVHVRARVSDVPVEVTVSLLTPYAAYLPAERLGASGVIAVVVAGLYLAGRRSEFLSADTRLTGHAVWETLTFLLNSFVFVLLGFEVPFLVRHLPAADLLRLVGVGVAVTAAAVAIRAVWIFAGAGIRRLAHRGGAASGPAASLVISWAGMRGAVSLAAALSLPLELGADPFPQREALIVVTLVVIVLTLVGQGLTLPALIRFVRLGDGGDRDEETVARRALVESASRRIDELYEVWPGHVPLLDQLRASYEHRSEHVERQAASAEADRELIEHREIRRSVIGAERAALLRLRADGAIDDDLMRRLERDLDLEEQRMEA